MMKDFKLIDATFYSIEYRSIESMRKMNRRFFENSALVGALKESVVMNQRKCPELCELRLYNNINIREPRRIENDKLMTKQLKSYISFVKDFSQCAWPRPMIIKDKKPQSQPSFSIDIVYSTEQPACCASAASFRKSTPSPSSLVECVYLCTLLI